MPLSEFAAPEVTDAYLKGLTPEQLIDLLCHKTNGILVAYRLKMVDTRAAKNLQHDVEKIHEHILGRKSDRDI
jgi:hypothetical protein